MELEKSGAQLIKKDRQVSTSLTLNQRLSLDQTGWFFSRDRSRIYFLFFFFFFESGTWRKEGGKG